VRVAVGVGDQVAVGVVVGVAVSIGVGVRVAVCVGVSVGVLVAVAVEVGVPVPVGVGVCVAVCVGVSVAVSVEGAVAVPAGWTGKNGSVREVPARLSDENARHKLNATIPMLHRPNTYRSFIGKPPPSVKSVSEFIMEGAAPEASPSVP